MKKRHLLLRLIFIFLNNLYAVPTYLMWMLLIRPLKFIYRPSYHYIEGTLYSWLLEMVAFWIHSNNVIVHETGDDIKDFQTSHALVVCNHQSTSDVPLLMHYMSSKKDVANQVCWIMNIMFKYTNFGWVSQVHHDFFIREGKATRDQQINFLKAYLHEIYICLNRKWLILFPEGGFFYKRKEASRKYAKQNKFPDLNHCSLPRTGALQAILSTLVTATPFETTCEKARSIFQRSDNLSSNALQHRNRLEFLIDLTILYPNGYALSIFDLICRKRMEPLHVVVVTRKFDISELACLNDQEFQAWFFELWKQKDLMMDIYYNEGVIVEPGQLKESIYHDAKSPDQNCEYKDLINSSRKGDDEDNHSSDGEEGYQGIDTEFLESFKRSWSEAETSGPNLEALPKVSDTTETMGLTVDQLPYIGMSYTRLMALHLFFFVSIYFHYFLIKTIVNYAIKASLLLV